MRMLHQAPGARFFALGVVATTVVTQLFQRSSSQDRGEEQTLTALGRAKRRGEKAFILSVELRFSDERDAQVPRVRADAG